MTNKKSTKRALLSSALATFLCAAMLIGSTFAWFTDTASTAINKIQSGKLDVELLAEDGVTSLEGETLQWQKAEGAEDEEILWEPGCTYKLQPIVIKNSGNLALKYKIVISGIDGSAKLNSAIEWTVGGVSIDEEKQLLPDAFDTLTIEGHMKESAGNDYQNLSINGIGITVYATQDTVEYDSETNTYDENAKYPSTEMVSFSGVSGTVDYNVDASGYDGAVYADNGAKVTVNADVTATEQKGYYGTYAMAVWAKGSDTEVTINGGYFTQKITGVAANPNQLDMIYASGGAKINITGGTFKLMCGDYKWTLNCQDNSGSVITVTGGTFYKFDPSADRGQPGEVVVPDGYKVVQNGDWYTVVAE